MNEDCPHSETRPSFGTVSDPWWGEVYIIGGGPSLRGFDFERLRGRNVLAVNDAALHVPWAAALFSLDQSWLTNRRQLVADFPGEAYIAVPDDADFNTLPARATYLLRVRGMKGLSRDPARIYMGGGNSGYGALNLAYLKRTRRIVLLGFDFCLAGQHWHRGYAWAGRSNGKMYMNWGRQVDAAADQLREARVEVLNASPISLLQAYPRVDLEDLPLPKLEVT